MNCPACGTEDSSVMKTLAVLSAVMRKRSCPCGATWRTKETRVKGTLVARPSQPLVVQDPLFSSGISSPSDPNPQSSMLSEPRARKGRGDAVEYPLPFERIWAGCAGRRGNKYPAFKAWAKIKPDPELVIKRWSQWRQTGQFKFGSVPHLSSWLNDRGWETEPTPEDLRPWSNGKAPAPRAQADIVRATDAKLARERVEHERIASEPVSLADLAASRAEALRGSR